MPEHGVLPEVLERFLDQPVVSPPLEDIRTEGAAVRRRRRRGVIASCAAVLVIAGSAFAGQTLFGSDDRTPSPEPDVARPSVLEPPDGTRWAGIGGVVLAVPEHWSDGRTKCNQPLEDTVYFPADVSRACGIVGAASSLAISDQPFERRSVEPPPVDGQVAGHDVRTTRGCLHAIDGPCFARISVPDLGAYFEVTIYGVNADERVQAIRDSLTMLPPGKTTVPYFGPGPWQPRDVNQLAAEVEAAGFDPVVETLDCQDMGLCVVGAWLIPAASHVIADGARVTIRVLPGLDKPTAGDPLSCTLRSSGTIERIPPESPTDARAKDYPTTPAEAAQRTIDAPLFEGHGNVTLNEGGPVTNGGVRFTASNAAGDIVVNLLVREVVAGAWATSETESCVGG